MAYNPNEPRNKDGEWTDGGAQGHNAGKGDRALKKHILKQHKVTPIRTFVRGAVAGGAIGGLGGALVGAGVGAASVAALPVLIPGAAFAGALTGGNIGSRLGAGVGGLASLVKTHKRALAAQHEYDSGKKLKK